MSNPIIDPEFRALIPPLSTDEREQLEANIVAEGCRDALVVWQGILLDGHNRLEICGRLGLPYRTVEIELPDRDAAADWIDKNQLGRRNLTPDQMRLLRGRRYNRAKKAHGGTGANQYVQSGQNDHSAKTAERLASEHGVTERTIRRDGKFAEEVERTPELLEAVSTGKPVLQVRRELKERNREARRERNRERIVAAPDISQAESCYSTIVIDPPWDWGDEGDNDQLGRARPDYNTMSIEQIADLPISKLSDTDCHLYLWITNRSLPKGFSLIERWGFRYITAITWVKPHFGMGNYFRGQTEHILFAVKGSQPLKRRDIGTVFNAPRGPNGHSSKPSMFYDIVESCSPGPYLEMFSRSERDGWVSWGEVSNV